MGLQSLQHHANVSCAGRVSWILKIYVDIATRSMAIGRNIGNEYSMKLIVTMHNALYL